MFNLPPLRHPADAFPGQSGQLPAIVYGIGAFSLSQDIGVSVAEADKYIKDYLRTLFRCEAVYGGDTIAFGKEHGYVQTSLAAAATCRNSPPATHNLKAFGERVAMNTPIQGTAADIIKIAMVRVHRRQAAEG